MLNNDLIQAVLNAYDDVDKSHGSLHIQQCLKNAEFGYHKTDFQNCGSDFLSEDFVYLCVAMHDIGLSLRMCKEAGIDSVEDSKVRREFHNTNSAQIFDTIFDTIQYPEAHAEYRKSMPKIFSIIDAGFGEVVFNEQLLAIGSHAILHHRASVSQITVLDKFLRTCDGINSAEDIIYRHVLHNYYVNGIKDFDELFYNVKNHLVKKYTGPDAYAKEVPLAWGNVKYQEELKRLKSFSVVQIRDLAKKYFDEETK